MQAGEAVMNVWRDINDQGIPAQSYFETQLGVAREE